MAYTPNLTTSWIAEVDGLKKPAIDWAENFGRHLAQSSQDRNGLKKLSTSQLRKFFGNFKRIQGEGYELKNETKLLMLKPLLAYAVGRDGGKTKLSDFESQIKLAIDEVLRPIEIIEKEITKEENAKIRFKNFVNLVEAVVAYHKSEGGE